MTLNKQDKTGWVARCGAEMGAPGKWGHKGRREDFHRTHFYVSELSECIVYLKKLN